jgi:hypothetical protein
MHRSNRTHLERISDEQWFAENGHLTGFGVQVDSETLAAFERTVKPLEQALGKPLNGPGRQKCLRAFKENPEVFERLADDALTRGRVNPLGLLIRMVEAGDHRLEREPETKAEAVEALRRDLLKGIPE